ncbi:MAG TPA: NAD-dependent protein deacetylase [Polyangia bacterium]|nr:NAD-dependent protein deacetylase [Polyangia bacterium]
MGELDPGLRDVVQRADASFEALVALLAGRRIVALTGAGCSTESGIPDYRGNGRPPSRTPIQHDAFVRRPDVRQRYWARSTIGWERFSRSRPNPAHHALAALEAAGIVRGVITQNVDRLHHTAGSRRVIELHGALSDVFCLECGVRGERVRLQSRLLEANPTWLERMAVAAPDGDAELPASEVASFRVLGCEFCGGALMPDVVFFGGSVGQDKVAAAWSLVEEADALLVVGSSLAVYSGWRFVRGAAERGVPVAVVNLGGTRADGICTLHVDAKAGDVLPRLAARLLGR